MMELFQNMVALSLQVGVLIAIVLLFCKCRKKPYHVAGRYFLWLMLAVRLLIPVNMEWFQIENNTNAEENVFDGNEEEQIIDSREAKTGQMFHKEPSTDSAKEQTENPKVSIKQKENGIEEIVLPVEKDTEKINGLTWYKNWYSSHKDMLWNIGLVVWMTGIFVMAAYEVLRYQAVYKSIRRWQKAVPENYVQELEKVKKEMHICKEIEVYQCRAVFSPMLVGLRKPTIVLPEKTYDKERLYFIYKHELTHFLHKDLYYKWIQTITRCMYWFQPMVHVMYQQSAVDLELFCDEGVTKNESKEFCQAYSFVLLETLTKQNVRQFPFSTCFVNGGKKQMKKRFIRIMSENKASYGKAVFCAAVVVALILGNVSLSSINAEETDRKSDVCQTEEDTYSKEIKNSEGKLQEEANKSSEEQSQEKLNKSSDNLSQDNSNVSNKRKKAKQSKKKYTEKEKIFYKMLNSVDYYDTAEGRFTTLLGEGGQTEIEFMSDLNQTIGYESVKNEVVDTELYIADGMRHEYDNKENTYTEDTNVITEEIEIPTDEERMVEEADGSKTYNYREKLSNLANADMVLAPQEITFSFLGDFSLWKITGQETYLGRKCIKIKGTTEEYYREKLDVAEFTFWVDAETGFLLKYEGYNEKNEVRDYIRTEEIIIDKPVMEKKSSKKNYKKVE